MTYGLYRNTFGDLYKLSPHPLGVLVQNLTNRTESVSTVADQEAQIASGWLIKLGVADLGSDTK